MTPQHVRIYIPSDEYGQRMIEAATTLPPTGSLAGWTGVDVDVDAWEALEDAQRRYQLAAAEAKITAETLCDAVEAIAEELDR